MVQEQDVGIVAYANDAPAVEAILRHRYTDFKVSEVGLDMQVARYSGDQLPEQVARPAATFENPEAVKALTDRLREVAGEANAEAFSAYIAQLLAREERVSSGKEASTTSEPPSASKPPEVVLSGLPDKAARTAVHMMFKGDTGLPRLVTDTVTDASDNTAIRIMTQTDLQASASTPASNNRPGNSKDKGGRGRQKRPRPVAAGDVRGLSCWEGGDAAHTCCVLHKTNADTHAALAGVAKVARLESRHLSIAGTKDKRGVTAQWVTAFKVNAAKLRATNGRVPGVRLGSFCYRKAGLQLGALAGNVFTLTLRGIEAASKERVAEAARRLRETGFINYFGLQRFGAGGVPTHEIGFLLLKGDWKGAVEAIMAPREDEPPHVTRSRERYAAGEFAAALEQMPRHMVAERSIVEALQKDAANWLQALQSIPRHLRTMYVHAAQSYFWNAAVSQRVSQHGLCVRAGDHILEDAPWPDGHCGGTGPRIAAGVAATPPAANGKAAPLEAKKRRMTSSRQRLDAALVATQADVDVGRWDVEHISLPMPGGAGGGAAAGDALRVYSELAEKAGVVLGDAAHGVAEFSLGGLTGDQRRVVARPRGLAYHFVQHAALDDELVATGLPPRRDSSGPREPRSSADQPLPPPPPVAAPLEDAYGCEEGSTHVMHEGGACLSLIVSFALPASSYATMLMRELLKMGTTVAEHKAASAARKAAAS